MASALNATEMANPLPPPSDLVGGGGESGRRAVGGNGRGVVMLEWPLPTFKLGSSILITGNSWTGKINRIKQHGWLWEIISLGL